MKGGNPNSMRKSYLLKPIPYEIVYIPPKSIIPSQHPLPPAPSPSPTSPPLTPHRRRRIRLAPRRRIPTRPDDRLGRHILIARARHHAAHDPRAPGHMRRHANDGANGYARGLGPGAGPDGGAGDDVFGCAGGGGGGGFFGFG